MNKLLTLAIASYNMEEYICRCLDSVTGNQIPDTLEIIVVNDGSKDKTSDIAHRYESEHPDIVRVIDKENGHYGSCINIALAEAKGKYFRPLDADDWMNTNNLVKLLDLLQNCDADLVVTEYTRFKQNGAQYLTLPTDVVAGKVYDGKTFDIKQYNAENILSMHSMTYRTSFLREIGLKLETGISYTDTQYCMMPLDKIKTIVFLGLNIYQYDSSRDGQTMQKNVLCKSTQAFYKLSTILSEYYIANSADNSDIIKSNQRCILRRVLYYFLVSTLVFGYNKGENGRMLNALLSLTKSNDNLWKDVNSFTYKGIPFVKCWTRLHIRIFTLIPNSLL